jgi:toxin YoeB
MAKRKIIWHTSAKNDLINIMKYYNQRNGSTAYSQKLLRSIKKTTKLLISNVNLGFKTDMNERLRVLISGDYKIFYEILDNSVEVYLIWDCRSDSSKSTEKD